MATPTTTARRAQGFGAQRFLVRGVDFTSEESLGIIRPRITEYPERFALIPGFPEAGRRGGSRPRAEGPAAEGVGILPAPLYPIPRQRPENPVPLPPSPGGGPAAGIAAACAMPDGNFRVRSVIGLAAGTTNVAAQGVFRAPALITTITFVASNAAPDLLLRAQMRVSPNNDTSGGMFTSGATLIDSGAAQDVNPFAEPQTLYPNVLVSYSPWFLKFAVDNQTAAAVNVIMWVSFIYLP